MSYFNVLLLLSKSVEIIIRVFGGGEDIQSIFTKNQD